jgi:hypothetical protein
MHITTCRPNLITLILKNARGTALHCSVAEASLIFTVKVLVKDKPVASSLTEHFSALPPKMTAFLPFLYALALKTADLSYVFLSAVGTEKGCCFLFPTRIS